MLSLVSIQRAVAQDSQPQRINYQAPPELQRFVSDWADLLSKHPDAAKRYSLLDRQRAKSVSGLEIRMFCFPEAQVCVPDPIPLPELPE